MIDKILVITAYAIPTIALLIYAFLYLAKNKFLGNHSYFLNKKFNMYELFFNQLVLRVCWLKFSSKIFPKTN